MSPSSCVRQRWSHTSEAGQTSELRTVATGIATTSARAMATTVHAVAMPGRRAMTLAVTGAVSELDGGRLELASGGHVDVVLLELAPPRHDLVHRGLGIDRVLLGDVGEHLLGLGAREKLE